MSDLPRLGSCRERAAYVPRRHATAVTCPDCGGTGRTIDKPCPECQGQGRVPRREHLTIEIPLGIHDGQQIRVQGRGEAGMQGAPAGDLIATVRIDPTSTSSAMVTTCIRVRTSRSSRR